MIPIAGLSFQAGPGRNAAGCLSDPFSRVKELKRYSLDVPQVTELADELKAAGMEIPCGILTIDELVAALEPLLKRKEA